MHSRLLFKKDLKVKRHASSVFVHARTAMPLVENLAALPSDATTGAGTTATDEETSSAQGAEGAKGAEGAEGVDTDDEQEGAQKGAEEAAKEGEGAAADAQGAEVEGGRAAPTRVAGKRKFVLTISDRCSNIEGYNITGGGKDTVQMSRPTGDEEDGHWTPAQVLTLWKLWEGTHRQVRENKANAERFAAIRKITNGTNPNRGNKWSKGVKTETAVMSDHGTISPHEQDGTHPPVAQTAASLAPEAAGGSSSSSTSAVDHAAAPEPVPEGSGLPPQVWGVFPLSKHSAPLQEIIAGIGKQYFLAISDAHKYDVHGNLYCVPPDGVGKNGSLCGKFPHAIVKEHVRGQKQPVSPTEGYYCVDNLKIEVRVQLMQRLNGVVKPASAHDVMETFRKGFTMHERENWGTYVSKFNIHLQMEFEQEYEGQDCRINANSNSAGCAFRNSLPTGSVLVPAVSDHVYVPHHYEKPMEAETLTFGMFNLQKGVTASNLVDRYKGRKFQMVARVCHHYLGGLPGFTVRSFPFGGKCTIQNDVPHKQRFVVCRSPGGEIRESSVADVPS